MIEENEEIVQEMRADIINAKRAELGKKKIKQTVKEELPFGVGHHKRTDRGYGRGVDGLMRKCKKTMRDKLLGTMVNNGNKQKSSTNRRGQRLHLVRDSSHVSGTTRRKTQL